MKHKGFIQTLLLLQKARLGNQGNRLSSTVGYVLGDLSNIAKIAFAFVHLMSATTIGGMRARKMGGLGASGYLLPATA